MYDPLELGKILAGRRELVKVCFYCVPPPVWLLNGSPEDKKKYIVTNRYYSALSKLPKVEIKYGYLARAVEVTATKKM